MVTVQFTGRGTQGRRQLRAFLPPRGLCPKPCLNHPKRRLSFCGQPESTNPRAIRVVLRAPSGVHRPWSQLPFLADGAYRGRPSIIKSWPENSSGARGSAQAGKPPPHLSLPQRYWRAGAPDLLILWFIPPLAYLLCSQHHARHLAYVTSSPLHPTSSRYYPHFTGEETKV